MEGTFDTYAKVYSDWEHLVLKKPDDIRRTNALDTCYTITKFLLVGVAVWGFATTLDYRFASVLAFLVIDFALLLKINSNDAYNAERFASFAETQGMNRLQAVGYYKYKTDDDINHLYERERVLNEVRDNA